METTNTMNKKNNGWDKCLLYIRKGMLIIAAFTFFGYLYPDLFMVEDTCKVVVEAANGEEVSVPQGSELYYSLLSAKPGEVKIKSRLLEAIQSYMERTKQEE